MPEIKSAPSESPEAQETSNNNNEGNQSVPDEILPEDPIIEGQQTMKKTPCRSPNPQIPLEAERQMEPPTQQPQKEKSKEVKIALALRRLFSLVDELE